MTIYAVMKSGGKEYRVASGDVLRVEKLAAAPGAIVEIREVLSIETAHGVTTGSPIVADACVIAEVIEEGHGEKILIFKKKRRDHYQMMTGNLQSFTALRIRDITVGESVYAAAMPGRDVAAAATPPPPPPRMVKPEREIAESPASIELLPPVAARPRVETAPPAQVFPERAARKRSHRIAALIAGLLVIAAGLLVWGSREPRAPGTAAVEIATVVAAPAQAAQPSVPPPAAKAPPRKDLAVKKTAAVSAPSAPVQPPE